MTLLKEWCETNINCADVDARMRPQSRVHLVAETFGQSIIPVLLGKHLMRRGSTRRFDLRGVNASSTWIGMNHSNLVTSIRE